MRLLHCSLVIALAHSVDLGKCKSDGDYFIQNSAECTQAVLAAKPKFNAPAAANDDFRPAIDALTSRSADISGCGQHRMCTACRDSPIGCYWQPGIGCSMKSSPAMQSVCTAANNVAPKCPAFTDCYNCALQNGCVFFKGQCVYSSGEGCLRDQEVDPNVCVTYAWKCPVAAPQPIVVTGVYASDRMQQVAPPVQARAPDRVELTMQRIEDMIIGMSASELRRLRERVDSALYQAEAALGGPVYTPPFYGTTFQAQPSPSVYGSSGSTANPFQFADVVAPVFTPSQVYGGAAGSYPPAYTTASVTTTTDGYVSSFFNSESKEPSFMANPWSAVSASAAVAAESAVPSANNQVLSWGR